MRSPSGRGAWAAGVPRTAGTTEAEKERNRRVSLRVILSEPRRRGTPPVIQKKICMLGGFGVGKTSLVSRYVHSLFSDKYLTTVGVKIEKKAVDLGTDRVDLMIWDLYGEDDFQKIRTSYLRGSAGYLLVADGTCRSTLATAVALQETAERAAGRVPFILLVNKADLASAGKWMTRRWRG